jgi:hypothetical protein
VPKRHRPATTGTPTLRQWITPLKPAPNAPTRLSGRHGAFCRGGAPRHPFSGRSIACCPGARWMNSGSASIYPYAAQSHFSGHQRTD